MQTIPLTAKPNQTVDVVLNSQSCTINLYQKGERLFLDLLVGGSAVLLGQICRDRCLIVRLAYLGFVGDLGFIDTQGASDPVYSGLNDRWQLLYFPPSDL
jgi:hypothetical protein